jgi:hypothetical protein
LIVKFSQLIHFDLSHEKPEPSKWKLMLHSYLNKITISAGVLYVVFSILLIYFIVTNVLGFKLVFPDKNQTNSQILSCELDKLIKY